MSLWIPVIIFFSFFAHSALGFGAGILAVPWLSLVMGVNDSVTLILIFQLLIGAMIVKLRRNIGWKRLRAMMPGMLIGVFLGMATLKWVDETFIRIFLAVFILLYLGREKLFPKKLRKKISTIPVFPVALSGGWIQGLVGTGGPVFVMYMRTRIKRKKIFRANLLAVIFITSVVRLVVSIPAGFLNHDVLHAAAISLPSFLLALWAGHKAHGHIPESVFFRIIDLLLVGSAVMLVYRAFF